MTVLFVSVMISLFSTIPYLLTMGFLLYPGVTIPITQAPHTWTPQLIEGIETVSTLGTSIPLYQALFNLGLHNPLGLLSVSLVVGCPAVLGSLKAVPLTKQPEPVQNLANPKSLNGWAKLRVGPAHSGMDFPQSSAPDEFNSGHILVSPWLRLPEYESSSCKPRLAYHLWIFGPLQIVGRAWTMKWKLKVMVMTKIKESLVPWCPGIGFLVLRE